jgi:hypothetical protein
MNGEQLGPKRSALRICLGAIVVFIGVGAVVGAAAITLKHYPAIAPSGGQPGNDRSSAVVAVLTPLAAAIAGVVGLYFGISATGSARGQQAQASTQVAQSLQEAAKSTTQNAQTASELAGSAKLLAQPATTVSADTGPPVVAPTPPTSGAEQSVSRQGDGAVEGGDAKVGGSAGGEPTGVGDQAG